MQLAKALIVFRELQVLSMVSVVSLLENKNIRNITNWIRLLSLNLHMGLNGE